MKIKINGYDVEGTPEEIKELIYANDVAGNGMIINQDKSKPDQCPVCKKLDYTRVWAGDWQKNGNY